MTTTAHRSSLATSNDSPARGGFTTFEQVILINSLIIVGSTLSAFAVTHAAAEPYHFLIDTLFVLGATLAAVGINVFLLRRTFRPLFALLNTIDAVRDGTTQVRAPIADRATDVAQIAHAFNAMLDSLDAMHQAGLRAAAQAQETERRRLALELHDATGQELTALLLRLELLRQDLVEQEAPAQTQAQMQGAIDLTQQTLTGVQRLAHQLRPAVLDDLGLPAALQWLANQFGTEPRLRITVSTPLPLSVIPSSLAETMLFRVAQEAVANAVRHSAATTIAITLQDDGEAISLTVQDDGSGFDHDTMQQGSGLRGMQERMAFVGGSCAVETQPGCGTRIRARLRYGEEGR